jgi:hypothetical protein
MTTLKLPESYYWLWSLNDLCRYSEYVSSMTDPKKKKSSGNEESTQQIFYDTTD